MAISINLFIELTTLEFLEFLEKKRKQTKMFLWFKIHQKKRKSKKQLFNQSNLIASKWKIIFRSKVIDARAKKRIDGEIANDLPVIEPW